MYSWPSMSHRYAPSPPLTNTGEPPTARNARTGEFTPPAMTPRARANAEMDRSRRKLCFQQGAVGCRINVRKYAFVRKSHALRPQTFDGRCHTSRSARENRGRRLEKRSSLVQRAKRLQDAMPVLRHHGLHAALPGARKIGR